MLGTELIARDLRDSSPGVEESAMRFFHQYICRRSAIGVQYNMFDLWSLFEQQTQTRRFRADFARICGQRRLMIAR